MVGFPEGSPLSSVLKFSSADRCGVFGLSGRVYTCVSGKKISVAFTDATLLLNLEFSGAFCLVIFC
jgi:hypothetical protein